MRLMALWAVAVLSGRMDAALDGRSVSFLLKQRPLLAEEKPQAGEGPTKDLLSLNDALEKRAKAWGKATAVPSQDAAAPGLVFTIQPSEKAHGLSLKPAGGADAWDLSAFGHVEARVVNAGAQDARLVLRVDNEGDWQKSPFSTAQIDLPPGERGTLKVVFGYQFGQKGFPLNPKRIVNILFYVDHLEASTSLRIESLVAAGPPGETQYVPPPPLWFKRGTGVSDQKPDPKRWKLVWSDEFDYTGLPDPAKWGYEEGYLRNKEPQYYTRSRRENAWVEGGVLTLTARKEPFPIPGGQHAAYTSASLITQGKASWTYGRIEMRAKLPKGLGAWPALWTGGINGSWPAAGEIDIMEYWAPRNTVTSNLHFALKGKHTGTGGALDVENPWDDFHLYAVEWNSERMDFFCNQTKYYTFDLSHADENGDNPYRKPHSLLLSLALVGGKGAVDDNSLPQKFVIDYIRVYEPVEAHK
jgi:beta-glucanase (GH16 family)